LISSEQPEPDTGAQQRRTVSLPLHTATTHVSRNKTCDSDWLHFLQ